MFFQKRNVQKRRSVPVEDKSVYLEILKQMLSEVLLRQKVRLEDFGNSPWRVPYLVTGMHDQDIIQRRGGDSERLADKEDLMWYIRERDALQKQEEGRGRSRHKRMEDTFGFVKKTVLPYPRLG